jgi:hypothetical protein
MTLAKSSELVCLSLGPILVILGIALVLSRRIFTRVELTRRELMVVLLGAADLVLAGWVGLRVF